MNPDIDRSVKFLQSLFPNINSDTLLELLQTNDIQSTVTLLLNDDNEFQDLNTLKSMFPDTDELVLYESWLNYDDIESSINYLINYNSKVADLETTNSKSIILPKQKHQNQVKITIQDEQILTQLTEIFPKFNPDSILDVYIKNSKVFDQTVVELSNYADVDQINSRDIFNNQITQLKEMFPNIHTTKLVHYLNNHKTVEETIETLFQLNDSTNQWNGTLNIKDVPKKNTTPEIGFHFDSKRESNITISNQVDIAQDKKHQDDPLYFRRIANDFMRERNNNFMQAANHFSRGQLTGRKSAEYYSELGRNASLKMHLFMEKAADAQLEYNRARHNRDPNVIDLHGLTVKQAKERLELYSNQWALSNTGWLKIITGAGNHSKGKGKLYPAMYSFMTQRKWRTKEGGDGWFFVSQ
ncbi:hypothetical protein HDV02_006552 [Globomyces sp. JEL0801]|nr:hypothetical protein HDV02_006552 [Globomyces sp. JEL0801]